MANANTVQKKNKKQDSLSRNMQTSQPQSQAQRNWQSNTAQTESGSGKSTLSGSGTSTPSGGGTSFGGTGKTMDQYYNDIYNKSTSALNEQHASRQATDEQTKQKINEAIDRSTKASTGQYQTQIDNAPAESRAQYDKNALNDAVARKQIQERLSNMGVTNSGMNSSMQTAMAIQKSRADATVRSEEQAKVQAAQNAINQLIAQGESQKAERGIAIDQKTHDWYNDTMANLPTTAYGMAQSSYQFDQTMANEQANRDWQANQNQLNREHEANQNLLNQQWQTGERVATQNWQAGQNQLDRNATGGTGGGGGTTTTRADVAQQLMKDYGYTPEQATAASYQIMPSEDPKTNLYYQAFSNGYSDKESQIYANAGGGTAGEDAVQDAAAASADSFVNGLNLKVTGWSTFWGNQDADGGKVASQVKTLLDNNQQFKGMSAAEQNATKAAAVGRMVASNWAKSGDATDNDARLKVACNQLGVDYHAARAYYDVYYQGN